MAKVTAAWGIDIGQCALKAIRCQVDPEDPTKLVADAFDYIEYPRILTQPEAEPESLIREALKIFLSRNDVRGDRVAISVSGQNGLARFIKLPPVETKKIPDIVRYEANQQIPFELDEVIWDYQRMFGGSEEDGFALEAEVGLFAMKREQVYESIKPFGEVGIDVDMVQLSPLSIYNFIAFDQLRDMIPEDEYDPDDPPISSVVLSVGTETTDLVITNGFRVWQRSIPLGGSHFTKALVRELQLTYAKAEHLKRNATQAEDPKAVYQAMRPVFKDLLTEVQRSNGYFNSLDRSAKIGKVVALGNSMKLPGLKRYLSQNLGEEIEEIEEFSALGGGSVVGAPAFKDNLLCFGVPYGLTIQALGLGRLGTNLIPREVVRDRVIREKKPWAVAAALMLMVGFLANYLLLWWPWYQVRIESSAWKQATGSVADIDRKTEQLINEFEAATSKFHADKQKGAKMVAHANRRGTWLEMIKAVSECLPQEPGAKRPENLAGRREIHIESLTVEKMGQLSNWSSNKKIQQLYRLNRLAGPAGAKGDGAARAADDPRRNRAAARDAPRRRGARGGAERVLPARPPKGIGFVVQIIGYHYYKGEPKQTPEAFVRSTFVRNLDEKTVLVPGRDGAGLIEEPIRNLGISYPTLVYSYPPEKVVVPNPKAGLEGNSGANGAASRTIILDRYRFVVQFGWQPRPRSQRRDARAGQVAQSGAGARR